MSKQIDERTVSVIRMQTEVAKLGLDLNGVINCVVVQAEQLTQACGAVIELVDGEEMVYRAVSGTAANQLNLRLKKATSLSGLCVSLSRPIRCDDSETDPRVNREACRKVGARSMIVVPLIHLGVAVGVLKVFSPKPAHFNEADISILDMCSELIAASMYHATKYGADELYRRATKDALTGLSNRAAFDERLRIGLAAAKRDQQRLALFMIDMDGLKPINDNHGHRAGDAALIEIGRRLSNETRESDTVARLGGDEFAVILVNVTDERDARLAALRMTDHCECPFSFEGTALKMGASIGVSIYPDHCSTANQLIESADLEMYQRKRERKSASRPLSVPLDREPKQIYEPVQLTVCN